MTPVTCSDVIKACAIKQLVIKKLRCFLVAVFSLQSQFFNLVVNVYVV